MPGTRTALIVLAALVSLAAVGFLALGSSGSTRGAHRAAARPPSSAASDGILPAPHPRAVDPSAGVDAGEGSPVGNPNAHAPSDAEIRQELAVVQSINKAIASPGGLVFPIQPMSVAVSPSAWSLDMGV